METNSPGGQGNRYKRGKLFVPAHDYNITPRPGEGGRAPWRAHGQSPGHGGDLGQGWEEEGDSWRWTNLKIISAHKQWLTFNRWQCPGVQRCQCQRVFGTGRRLPLIQLPQCNFQVSWQKTIYITLDYFLFRLNTSSWRVKGRRGQPGRSWWSRLSDQSGQNFYNFYRINYLFGNLYKQYCQA